MEQIVVDANKKLYKIFIKSRLKEFDNYKDKLKYHMNLSSIKKIK